MAIKINFDVSNIPENPTLILATRKGDKLGKINAHNIVIKDSMTDGAEITFSVNKYTNNVIDNLWNKIKDYKLVYCKEADLWFQAKVDIDELSNAVKNVSCVQLAQAELSQIMLYNIEINTENDIARDDYVSPTILYNDSDHSVSLLHRIMEKVPHYQIIYVSSTITNIQRTFTFDDISLYDAFQNIAEEIGCLFIFHSDTDNNGNIRRGISVYDLESYCSNCGNRGHFINTCPKCNSTNILEGYGEDTTIFITADELGNDIKFTSDTDSQKNCFKLEAGDDLMTATIRNCNPNGTDYIWYIPDYIKEDMSTALVSKLSDYETLYNTYNITYSMAINQTLLEQYNQLINKYVILRPDFTALVSPIVGYSNLITAYYQTIDFAMYLQSEMLPTVTISQINADTEIAKLTTNNSSPVAVINTSNLSLATANNAVLSVAKCLINSNYKIKISSSNLSGTTWSGIFYIENYSDEDDNATSESISITINADYSNYVNQKIQKVLSQSKQDTMDIVDLFDMSLSDFTNELGKYNLDSLNNLQSICQSCIDVMIEQGIAVNQSWNGTNLYNNLYMNYYNKLSAINNEQAVRENEVNIIIGKYNNDKLISQGIQTILNKHRTTIQTALNFENYLGSDLWLEFCAYKRESKYSNSNYISDGLNNAELFEKALEFIEKAKKELYTSAELQHSISASLKNLLVIPKFKILTQYFKVGNWLRILIDDNVYKLRLINYEIDYSNLENISVEFSDVLSTANGYTDEQSLIQKMSSMATSYSNTQHQAEQGSKTHITVNDWVHKGLNVTNNKIIQGTFNQTQTWDEHGMLFRQFDYETDDYDDCQLKIINSTLAVTDDNWFTVKTAVGKHYYIDPTTNQVTYAFGTNAETIVGKMILGEQLGIYNSAGSLTFNHNGFNITNSKNTFNVNPNATNLLTISKTVNNTTQNIFYVDNNGTLHITGDGSGLDISANNSITGLSSSLQQTANSITATVAATYETKTDATTKLNTAKGYTDTEITGAKSYADSGISTARTALESQITQTANSITATVAESQSKYDTTGYTISIYGYGNPTNTAYPPSNHNNEYYLNQSNGSLWLCNGNTWSQSNTLSLITDNLSSQITQTATSITTTVSNTYETKTDATSKLNTAKGYTDTEILGAKGYTDSSISTATTAISSQITQTADSIKSTIANSQSKYNTTGYAISIYGYGNPTNTAYPPIDHNGDYYLNQSNGSLWLCDGSSWSQSTTLSLITDDLSSQIIQTANSITSTVASNQSKYDTTGYTISIYGYSNPTTTDYPPSDYNGYYYLNQSNGNLYYCSGDSWISLRRLPLISDSMRTQITQNSDNISLIANKNASGTVLSLKPDVVNIAWNGLSQNIQFDTPASTPSLSIYTSSNKILMRLNKTGLKLYNGVNTFYPLIHFKTDGINIFESGTAHLNYKLNDTGNHFYLNSEQIGFIGSAKWSTSNTFRGMVTQLGKTCNYIAWSHTEEVEVDGETEDRNIVKLIYYPDKDVEGNNKKGFWFYDKVAFNYVVNCYNDLNMNGHTINNAVIASSSDMRMKTNIKDTEVNALEQINQIELKSFDWIENNEHENIGIIAQQLQEIIPDTVYEDPETTKLSIQPLKLIPYLIKAIQELSIDMGKSNTKGKINTKSNNSYWNIDLESKRNFVNQNIVHNNATKDIQLEILKLKTNELEMSENNE